MRVTTRSAAAAVVVLVYTHASQGAIIWGGPDMTFTKVDFADWTDPVNQDRITDDVWITRADVQGIFNIFSEAGYSATSPAGTEWAFTLNNPTEDVVAGNYENPTFQPSVDAVLMIPPAMVGEAAVLHLIEDDIYLDITFTQWTSSAQGGGFSYAGRPHRHPRASRCWRWPRPPRGGDAARRQTESLSGVGMNQRGGDRRSPLDRGDLLIDRPVTGRERVNAGTWNH